MPDDTYTLPRHGDESTRLDAQHEAYSKIIGYLLHPRIQAALQPDARIADVGTGTGVWLQDLAKTCPSTWKLQGFDISDEQFPPTNERYSIQYDRLNITEAIPEQYQGQFDVVHLRLLVCGLTSDQWELAARNLLQLLKPGGFLQWHESQFRGIHTYQSVPGASIENNELLIRNTIASLNRQGKMLDDVLRLRQTVQSVGFEDCAEDVFSTDRVPEVREQLKGVQFGAVQAISRALAAKDPGFQMSSAEVEEALRRAEKELEGDKAYYQWTMRVVTGRKPC